MEKGIREAFGLSGREVKTYSPLTLAYLGDCVYELVLRTVISEKSEASSKHHTSEGARLAKAPSQAALIKALLGEPDQPGLLTEEEYAIFKRGRNASPSHTAKNATTSEYRLATGFEALIGWLYLGGENERIYELIRTGWEKAGLL